MLIPIQETDDYRLPMINCPAVKCTLKACSCHICPEFVKELDGVIDCAYIDRPKTIYIAGRMVGFKYYNFPKFMKKEMELLKEGWKVINPARLDLDEGINPFTFTDDYNWSAAPDKAQMREIINRDIEALKDCDAIYMMKGWDQGTGAVAEHYLAKWMGKEIIYE
jgi:hypothetical protein